jgi:glycosyltransferase involved in cell wall biosynthesis
MLRVFLVTPTLNQGRFLRRTIESVLGQQGPFELDYLVVDGGSTDDTRAILEAYRGRLTYTSQPDRGQVDAINRGLALSTGEIVGWLNSDDLLLAGALERVVEAFRARPEVEWVHGRCSIIDESGREIQRWISRYKHARSRRHSWERLLLENYVSQPTAFWRRRVWPEVGPLDDSVPLAFDYDLWLRLARRGDPFYIEAPVAAFRRHPLSKSGQGYTEMFRQELRVARRYAADRPGLLRSKRWRMAAFSAVYRGLERVRFWRAPSSIRA